ncbi:hypothetical protein ACWEWG_37920 [Streptomyces sp. NPDC003758]|uniref:Uncharacterized protein n=1 Tax=Streptomyces cynarae TaxID=2981134 RepID=A0ABY6EG97_9ACTN|nr:hypothetical protein [Streptomyces cynarae]UXY24306.1 hypothetical protein N8I84_40850 [Streptomyces cynarae]
MTGETLLNTLVNPEVPGTEAAYGVHGISDEMVGSPVRVPYRLFA